METLESVPSKISSNDIPNRSDQTIPISPPNYTSITNIVLNRQAEGFGLTIKYQDKNKAENGNARHIGPDSKTTFELDLKTNVMQIKSEKSEFARLLTDESGFDEVFILKASKVAIVCVRNRENSGTKWIYFKKCVEKCVEKCV